MNKPKWLKDAIATSRGYESPKGELLKAAKLTQEQIMDWNTELKIEKKKTTKKAPAKVVEEVPAEEPVAVEEVPAEEPVVVEEELEMPDVKAMVEDGELDTKEKGSISKYLKSKGLN